jgi:hypothetical protein
MSFILNRLRVKHEAFEFLLDQPDLPGLIQAAKVLEVVSPLT